MTYLNSIPNMLISNEGYVKYNAKHIFSKPIKVPYLLQLNNARTLMYNLGLIGVNSTGVGYGNLSIRFHGDEFLITGTNTGAISVLSPNDYCLVKSFDIVRNSIISCGPVQASSESMTHGAIYRSVSEINCVIHIHSKNIFDGMIRDKYPFTPENAEYGTPDLAIAIENCVLKSDKKEGLIVLAGHDEGIIAYGCTVEKTLKLILEIKKKYEREHIIVNVTKENNSIMSKNKIKAAIFDLDGVIVDTAKYHYIAWKEIAKKYGFDFTESDNERLKGVSRMESLDILLNIGKIKISQKEKEDLATIKNERYKALIANMNPDEILYGVREFIESLRSNGILTALGSASKNSGFILEKLNILPLFDVVIDGNHVSNAKPNPEVFLKAAKLLNTLPENCVVFEDAQAGIEAAKAANMKCIGIGSPKILKNADLVIEGFKSTELSEILHPLCLNAKKQQK